MKKVVINYSELSRNGKVFYWFRKIVGGVFYALLLLVLTVVTVYSIVRNVNQDSSEDEEVTSISGCSAITATSTYNSERNFSLTSLSSNPYLYLDLNLYNAFGFSDTFSMPLYGSLSVNSVTTGGYSCAQITGTVKPTGDGGDNMDKYEDFYSTYSPTNIYGTFGSGDYVQVVSSVGTFYLYPEYIFTSSYTSASAYSSSLSLDFYYYLVFGSSSVTTYVYVPLDAYLYTANKVQSDYTINNLLFGSSHTVSSIEVKCSTYSYYSALYSIFGSSSYSDGYAEGYTDGYADGYNEGVDIGDDEYERGYNYGYEIGYDDGYAEGEDVGYDNGYSDGYYYGLDIGFELGYDSGYADGMAYVWSDPVVALLDGVADIFDIKLFGYFGLGTLFQIFLYLSVVLMFIKIFGGT